MSVIPSGLMGCVCPCPDFKFRSRGDLMCDRQFLRIEFIQDHFAALALGNGRQRKLMF